MARYASVHAALAASAFIFTPLTPSAHAAIPPYELVGSFSLPGSGPWDLLPDGRVLQLRGSDVFRQDALNASTYSRIGSLDPALFPNFGAGPSPSFLRVSPDGSRLAVGNNRFSAANAVYVADTAALNPAAHTPVTTITAPNFDAAWDGNSRLYVTGGDASTFASVVTRLDLEPNSIPPTATRVLTGIGDASGGVTVHDGSLYVGVGFLFGGSAGEIRRFDANAFATLTAPAAFTTGTIFADALSGASLGFDPLGNLLVGGGDSFGSPPDSGYAAVVDPAQPGNPLRLSPAGALSSYQITFNHATGELLVAGLDTAYRYAIPSPGALTALAALGLLAARRTRHA